MYTSGMTYVVKHIFGPSYWCIANFLLHPRGDVLWAETLLNSVDRLAHLRPRVFDVLAKALPLSADILRSEISAGHNPSRDPYFASVHWERGG